MQLVNFIQELEKTVIAGDKMSEMEDLKLKLMNNMSFFSRQKSLFKWALLLCGLLVIFAGYLIFEYKKYVEVFCVATMLFSGLVIWFSVWNGKIKDKSQLSVVLDLAKRQGWKTSVEKNKELAVALKKNFGNLFVEGGEHNYSGLKFPFWGNSNIDGESIPFFASSLEFLRGNGKSTTIIHYFILGFDLEKLHLPNKKALMLTLKKKLFSSNVLKNIENATAVFKSIELAKNQPGAAEAFCLSVNDVEVDFSAGQRSALINFCAEVNQKVSVHCDPSFCFDGKTAIMILGDYCDPYKSLKTNFFESSEVSAVDVRKLEDTVKLSGKFLQQFLSKF